MSYPSTILADAPLAYYRLDDTNSTLADSSGNGYNGYYSGSGYTQGVAGLIAGDPDKAVQFSSGYASATTSTLFCGSSGTGDFSLEIWLGSASTIPGQKVVLSNGDTTVFLDVNGGLPRLIVNSAVISGTTRVDDGNPHHIVGTRSGTAVVLYVDGAQAATGSTGSSTYAANGGSPGAWYIGTYLGSNSYVFPGTLDEAAVYNVALTPTQVSNHYAAGASSGGPTAGNVATANLTPTTLTVSTTAASGGTSPYNYQFQRAPDSSGSPGTWANIGPNSAATSYNDSGLTGGTKYWYRCVVTDSASKTADSTAVGVTAPTAATTYTLSGPSAGNINTASGNFTVQATGYLASSVAVTPHLSGVSGTFSPTTVTLGAGANTSATFTLTPSAAGTANVSTTNGGGLTDPGPLTYTVAGAQAFALGLASPVGLSTAGYVIDRAATYPKAASAGWDLTFSGTSLALGIAQVDPGGAGLSVTIDGTTTTPGLPAASTTAWPSATGLASGLTDFAATAISNATNAQPIVITSASHGLSTGNVVKISGVGGNGDANDTWTVTVIDANTFSLNNSKGGGAYTAGGSCLRVHTASIRVTGGYPNYVAIDAANAFVVAGSSPYVGPSADYGATEYLSSGTFRRYGTVSGPWNLADSNEFVGTEAPDPFADEFCAQQVRRRGTARKVQFRGTVSSAPVIVPLVDGVPGTPFTLSGTNYEWCDLLVPTDPFNAHEYGLLLESGTIGLLELRFCGGTLDTATVPQLRGHLVAHGDSKMVGLGVGTAEGAPGGQDPARGYLFAVAAATNRSLVNFGRAGSTILTNTIMSREGYTADVVGTYLSRLPSGWDASQDVGVWELAFNDLQATCDNSSAFWNALVAEATAQITAFAATGIGKLLVLATPPSTANSLINTGTPVQNYINTWNNTYLPSVVSSVAATYPTVALVAGSSSWINPSTGLADGVHFNSVGEAAMASNLAAIVPAWAPPSSGGSTVVEIVPLTFGA